MTTQITVPSLGESVTEATIAKWFKAVGDAVAIDEPVLELETASLWRSSDFGVITTSGLRKLRCSWRRSAWKKLAGRVQLITCMLSSAQSCR